MPVGQVSPSHLAGEVALCAPRRDACPYPLPVHDDGWCPAELRKKDLKTDWLYEADVITYLPTRKASPQRLIWEDDADEFMALGSRGIEFPLQAMSRGWR